MQLVHAGPQVPLAQPARVVPREPPAHAVQLARAQLAQPAHVVQLALLVPLAQVQPARLAPQASKVR